jgi:recombination protein RecA
MTMTARARLETLLGDRKLDHTLTTRKVAYGDWPSASTGHPGLDLQLKGGWPRGQISDLVGPRSSGRTSLLMSSLAVAIDRGEVVALVDTVDSFDTQSAAAARVDLTQLLWIRGQAMSSARASLAQEWGGFHTALDRALKALNLVLQTGRFGLVALDLADLPAQVIKRVPFTTWMRLQRVIEGSETVCVLMGAEPTARSAGGLTVALSRTARPEVVARPRMFHPSAIEPRVLHARWL